MIKMLKKIDFYFKLIMTKLFKRMYLNILLQKNNFFNFPIYIISFNRLEYLRQIIEWLKKMGYKNIIIIDNKSTFLPLLDFYEKCDCKVIKMKKNYGYKVFYKHPRFWFARTFTFYILTDPDLSVVEECPENFVELFLNVMRDNLQCVKVGFSLKIDDIPDDYELKDEVILWESQFYKKSKLYHGISLYDAEIDTTFSITSPLIFTPHKPHNPCIRVGYPYVLRHLPWYALNDSVELKNYRNTVRKDVSNWNGNISKEHMKKRIQKYMQQ